MTLLLKRRSTERVEDIRVDPLSETELQQGRAEPLHTARAKPEVRLDMQDVGSLLHAQPSTAGTIAPVDPSRRRERIEFRCRARVSGYSNVQRVGDPVKSWASRPNAQRPRGAFHIVKGRTASSIGSRQTMARSGSAVTAARRSSVASSPIPTRSASGWARSTAMPAPGPVSGRCRPRRHVGRRARRRSIPGSPEPSQHAVDHTRRLIGKSICRHRDPARHRRVRQADTLLVLACD
jgi:hypothetical protein